MLIWLASYPRSGNTFAALVLRKAFGIRFVPSDSVRSAFSTALQFDVGMSADQARLLAEPVAVKTHSLPGSDTDPAIYLLRDGRDSVLSYARFLKTPEGRDPTRDDANRPLADLTRELILEARSRFGNWSQNVNTWISRPNTAVVRFDDLIVDPEGVLEAALLELGVSGMAQRGKLPDAAELHRLAPQKFPGSERRAMLEEDLPGLVDLFDRHHGRTLRRVGYPSARWDRARAGGILKEMTEGVAAARVTKQEAERLLDEVRIQVGLGQRSLRAKLRRGLASAAAELIGAHSIGVLRQFPPRPLANPQTPRAAPTGSVTLRLAIVTPSFNHERFVARAVRSVLDQGYPALQYFVQDGGSTDGTLPLLRGLGAAFASHADEGQAQAINLGFRRVEGDILAWLNSDDFLLPGALHTVSRFFTEHPDVDAAYGHRVLVDEQGSEIGRWCLPPHQERAFLWADWIPQESFFFRRRAWDLAGGALDESQRFALDWDLILRMHAAGVRFARIPAFLAAFRVHPNQKTAARASEAYRAELDALRLRVHGTPISDARVAFEVGPYCRRARLYGRLYDLGLLRFAP